MSKTAQGQPVKKPIKKLRWLLLATLAIGLGLMVWAFIWEPRQFVEHSTEITLNRWPRECDGLRIAVLADIHVGAPGVGLGQLRNIVKTVNRQRADLTLLAGDYVIQGVIGGQFVAPEAIAQELGKLKSTLGTFAVLGNHDHWHDAVQISTAFSAAGVTMLEDQNKQLQLDNCQFSLVGISDFWEGELLIDQAYLGTTADSAVLSFTHNPDVFPLLPENNMLTMAGHTHGGQVRFPALGALVVPSKYGQRYAAGLVEENKQLLYVSSGIGTSILPVRFLVPPSFALLTLNSNSP